MAICNDHGTAELIVLAPRLLKAILDAVKKFDDGEEAKDLIYRLQELRLDDWNEMLQYDENE